jgi:hypothetical protein
LAEAGRSFTVERHNSFLNINYEDDNVGCFNRELDLLKSRVCDGVIGLFSSEQPNATCIDKCEGAASPFRLGGNTISSDSRLIVNNSYPAADNAVEKSGFSNIGPANNRNQSWCHFGFECSASVGLQIAKPFKSPLQIGEIIYFPA